MTRYLPKYLHGKGSPGSNEGFAEGVDDPKVVEQCQSAIRQIIGQAQATGAKPYVVLHWNQAELKRAAENKGWRPDGHRQIEETARAAGVEVMDLGNQEEAADYRDNIHLSGRGQKRIAGVIEGAFVRSTVEAKLRGERAVQR